MGKRIGLYGGSFDPIHFGHLNLAMEMLEKSGLSEVWFCPANVSPYKVDDQPASPVHRLNMLKLALEGYPDCSIIESELRRPSPSYTIDTIKELLMAEAGQAEARQFYLLLGEDSVKRFPHWHLAHEIVQLVPLLIGRRFLAGDEATPYADPDIYAAIQKGEVPTRIMEISSSEVRGRLRTRKCCRHLVPQKVLDYIETNHLY